VNIVADKLSTKITQHTLLPSLEGKQLKLRHTITTIATITLLLTTTTLTITHQPAQLETVATHILMLALLLVISYSPRVLPNAQRYYASGALLNATALLLYTQEMSVTAHTLFILTALLLALYMSYLIAVMSLLYIATYFFLYINFEHYPAHLSLTITDVTPIVLVAGAATITVLASQLLIKEQNLQKTKLEQALASAALGHKQARELNDTVIQNLLTALYAQQTNTPERVEPALQAALKDAKSLVSNLLNPSWVSKDTPLKRTNQSQPSLLPETEHNNQETTE